MMQNSRPRRARATAIAQAKTPTDVVPLLVGFAIIAMAALLLA